MNKLLDNTESLLGKLLYSRSLSNSTVLKSKVYCCRPLPFLVDFPLKVLTKLKLIQFTTIKIKAFSGTSACVIISNARKQLCEFGHSELWGNKQLESLWELSPQSEKKKRERERERNCTESSEFFQRVWFCLLFLQLDIIKMSEMLPHNMIFVKGSTLVF